MFVASRTRLEQNFNNTIFESVGDLQHPLRNRMYNVASTPLNLRISSSGNRIACPTHESGHPLGVGGEGSLGRVLVRYTVHCK